MASRVARIFAAAAARAHGCGVAALHKFLRAPLAPAAAPPSLDASCTWPLARRRRNLASNPAPLFLPPTVLRLWRGTAAAPADPGRALALPPKADIWRGLAATFFPSLPGCSRTRRGRRLPAPKAAPVSRRWARSQAEFAAVPRGGARRQGARARKAQAALAVAPATADAKTAPIPAPVPVAWSAPEESARTAG